MNASIGTNQLRTYAEKAAFLRAIDVLLPAIEKGGWAQFADPNTRAWIKRLAKYAYLFGFPEPPFVIRTITKPGDPIVPWDCTPSCREIETVTVNGPYTKSIVGPVELDADCCQPWHCKAYFALKEWREEVEAIPTEPAFTAWQSEPTDTPSPSPTESSSNCGQCGAPKAGVGSEADPNRKHRDETKPKLTLRAKLDAVKGFLEEKSHWKRDGTYSELSEAIKKSTRIDVSDTWLCNHRTELGLNRKGSPRRTFKGKNQREAVAEDGIQEPLDSYTMPDDDESIS